MASQVASLRPRTANGYYTLIRKDIGLREGQLLGLYTENFSREHQDQREGNPKYLFTTSHDTPFNPRFFNKIFKKQVELAGLPEIRLHDLRHFAISYLINVLHISPAIVQPIVGHASPMLTLNMYTHSSTQQQDEAM